MTNLSDPPTNLRQQASGSNNQFDPNSYIGSGRGMAKEIEMGSIGMDRNVELPLTEIGKDIEIPKEVEKAGVTIQPNTITVPPPLNAAGVQQSGSNVSLGSGASVTLPLSDDQITQGLHQNIFSSWRWLAEFCIRKLKQLHIVLKTIGGKTVEVKV